MPKQTRLNPEELTVTSFETRGQEPAPVLEATGTHVIQCLSPYCGPTVRKSCYCY